MKTFDFLIKAIEKGCIILMMIMTFVTFGQAFNRYILGGSFFWAEEAAIWSMIWITFLGATVALRRGKHPRIDFLVNMFPLKIRKWIEVFDYLVIASFLAFLGWYSIPVVQKTGRIIAVGLRIPRSIMFYSVLVGCALMVIYTILLAIGKAVGHDMNGGGATQ